MNLHTNPYSSCCVGGWLVVVGLLTSGLASAQSSASAYTSGLRYSTGGLLTGTIGPDPDGAGPLGFPAVRNTYDASGQLTRTEMGALSAWQADTVAPAAWTGFTVHRVEDLAYDWMGRKLSVQVSSGGTAYALTQFSYDAMGRLECTAVRMNPGAFASAPSACALGTQGVDGPDRITKNSYDYRGRLLTITKAFGTPVAQNYATYTYGTTTKPATVRDANGNVSGMSYDSLNRIRTLSFPSTTTPGQVNTNDYEEYTYDNNGNQLTKRTRDAQLLTYTYDALNRNDSKVPSSGNPTYYGYDLRGLQLYARFGSPSGYGINTGYDGFGRLISSTTTLGGFSRSVSSQYDANGNRTRITHPDGSYFVYTYDGLDRVSQILENGSTQIGLITYDWAGRRSQLSFGAAVSTVSYGYDPVSRVGSITHNLDGAGTVNDVALTFSYTPASQIKTRIISNDLYEFSLDASASRTYSVNGLNQYSSIVGATSVAPTWDGRGNLTYDGATSYSYDIENRLLSSAGANPGTLAYDPAGRLWQTSGGASGTTQFVYDGDRRVVEYSGAGSVLRRYVHGPGVDEPLAWYEGAAVTSTTRRYMHADHQGSIVAVASNAGARLQTNKYDPYGVPGASQTTPFQYTGQTWLPDQKLHYYKARIYSPSLGRFLQNDPIGYSDDLNLYAYTYNDPIGRTDPTGAIAETPWDALNVGMGVVSLASNVASGVLPHFHGRLS